MCLLFGCVGVGGGVLESGFVNLRRVVVVVAVALAITTVTVMVGLVTNAASSQESWPGWLEAVRQRPWQALGIVAVLAVLMSVLATFVPMSQQPIRPVSAVTVAEGEHDQVLVSGAMLPPDAPVSPVGARSWSG